MMSKATTDVADRDATSAIEIALREKVSSPHLKYPGTCL
jgi:hypothetical protein